MNRRGASVISDDVVSIVRGDSRGQGLGDDSFVLPASQMMIEILFGTCLPRNPRASFLIASSTLLRLSVELRPMYVRINTSASGFCLKKSQKEKLPCDREPDPGDQTPYGPDANTQPGLSPKPRDSRRPV